MRDSAPSSVTRSSRAKPGALAQTPDPIEGVHLLRLAVHKDPRGALVALDDRQGLPFRLKRVFYMFDLPAELNRANHAVSAHQMLSAPRGAVTATCNNGREIASFRIDRPDKGLYVEPGVHLQLSGFAKGTVLIVASSQSYSDVRYFDRPVYFELQRISA